MKKRLAALVLSMALVIQLLPVSALAEGEAPGELGNEAVAAEAGQPQATVIGELADRRGESEKHFRMSDGSFVAVDYGAPVHFTEDEGETWNDIDNTLALSRGDAELYVAENGDSVRGFASNLRDGRLLTVANGDYSLHMGLASDADDADHETRNASASAEISYPDVKTRGNEELSFAEQITPAKLRAEVLYRDVYEDVDLRYELYSYNVKETILVNAPRDSYAFSFSLDLDGLTPALLEDGSVELRDGDGEVVYLIPAPYLYDADGAESTAVAYTLEETGSGAWTLTVSADASWMNDENRTFPVAIDPTVIDAITWKKQGVAITYLEQGNPNISHGNWQMVAVGFDADGPLECQILFGVDNLPDVPTGSEVYDAMICLGKYTPNNSDPFDNVGVSSINVELHEVEELKPAGLSNSDWINGKTWSSVYNPYNPMEISDTILDYTTLSDGDTNRYDTWSITHLAKKWYFEKREKERQPSLPEPTRAACLKVSNPGQYGTGHYANVRYYGYGGYAPMLVVSYRDMTGIEPYYTYQALGADRAGTAYISDCTGALTTVTPLVSYASTVNPFSLSLIYNSPYYTQNVPEGIPVPLNLGYGMWMGNSMNLNLLQTVEYVDLQYEIDSSGTKRYIKYTDGDGTAHYFAPDPAKQANETGTTTYYYDEDGLGLKITEYVSNYFRMEDDRGNKMYFVYGYLTIIQDANGNSINLWFRHSDGNMATNGYPLGTGNYLDHITQKNYGEAEITVASFEYIPGSVPKKLLSITDAAGNIYSFDYSGNMLISIKRNADEHNVGNYIDFSYQTGSLEKPLIALTDSISSYSLCFTYADSKIASYCEKVGNTVGAGADISRVPGEKTTYTDWGNDRTNQTADDISTTYLFDYAGRTVNAFSTNVNGTILGASNAVYTGIGSTDKQNNRNQRSASIGTAAMPLLRNGGFERSDCNWTLSFPDSHANAIICSGANEKIRTGEKALKLWLGSSAVGSFTASRTTEQLIGGRTYTASVYVNTSGALTTSSSPGVYLEVTDGTHTFTGDDLNYLTNGQIDGGWARVSVSFTAPATGNYTVRIRDEALKHTIYFDDFQIEESEGPSNVNLLQNGGMTYWRDTWLNENNSPANFESGVSVQGSGAYSLKLVGDPLTDRFAYQTVPVNQPGTQTYVLSGWAKADAVPDNVCTIDQETDEEALAKDTNKQFGLRAVLTYADHTTEYHYVPFNTDVSDWQFTSLTIVPKQNNLTVSTIKVICAYEKNANTAYFDNLSLVKEAARTMTYDPDGNLVSVKSSGTKEETAAYQNGNLTEVETAGSVTFQYTYDNQHNLTEATNGTVKEAYEYDSVGNVLSSALTKAAGTASADETVSSSKTYTNSGNLVRKIHSSLRTSTNFEYTSAVSTMFGVPTKTIDPKGTETVVQYLNDGRVSESGISTYISLTRTYDNKNQLTELNRSGYNRTGNDPALYQQTYKFTYDAFGNTTGIRVGNTSTYNLGAYTYAPNDGLLTGMTWGNGATVSYTYDALGRKTQTATSSGDSYAYSYTGDGQLYQMTDVSGSLLYRYTYDTLGRLVGSVMKSGSSVCLQTLHHYDNANRLNRQIWSFGEGDKRYVEEYHYDANNGRLTKKLVKLPTDEYANITPNYDDLSRVSDVTTPAATTVYAYSPVLYGSGTTGLVSELTTTSVHTGTGVFEPLHLRYTYDALGNIRTEKRLNADDSTAESISYEYDNQSQLTQAHSSVTGTWSYQYDTYGNLRGTTHGSDTLSYTYGDANWIDLLTGVSGTKNGVSFSGSYVYDGAGNPTSFYNIGDRSTWTMSWKNGRELATATNGTHTVSYDYDGNGLRTWKLVDGIRHDYIYASGQLLRETFTQGGTGYTLDFLYDQNGRPYMLYLTTTVSGVPTSAPFYYVLNLQGDVIHLVRTNGVPAASYTYDPYGNVLSATGVYANVNPLRYRGYYYDTETGFYYLQSRYYAPALGRFINADSYASTGQGFLGYNMFAYCGNNPSVLSDHSGDHPLWQALFDDNDPGFIHRKVQEDIVAKATMKGESIGKERGVYNSNGKMIGRVDIYNSQTGQIWEVKYKTSQIAAADKARSYCGLSLEGCERKTSLGNSGRFEDSFTIGCGEYSFTVDYWTPEPGVILYSVSGPKKKVYENSYSYVPRASKERDSKTIVAIVIPAGVGAFGGCTLAFCGGGGYQCRPLYE